MKKYKRLILIITISILAAKISEAQKASGIKDSLAVKEQKSSEKSTNEKSQTFENKSTVKQIISAKPDMSRTNGARPPSIVRQSGSVVPKGIGKPGGARGAGRR